MIGRWRRTADTRGQLTAGGNRDCENRRLSSALPFFPACLPFGCLLERTDKQQTTMSLFLPYPNAVSKTFLTIDEKADHQKMLGHFKKDSNDTMLECINRNMFSNI